MKYSLMFIAASKGRSTEGGPLLTMATSFSYEFAADMADIVFCRVAARGERTRPRAATGLRSRTTRWVARSVVVQPSHSVGAVGPTRVNRSHRALRSDRCGGTVMRRHATAEPGARSTSGVSPGINAAGTTLGPVIPARAQALVDATADLAALFDDAGHRLYVVGGSVRDVFSVGDPPLEADIDLT